MWYHSWGQVRIALAVGGRSHSFGVFDPLGGGAMHGQEKRMLLRRV